MRCWSFQGAAEREGGMRLRRISSGPEAGPQKVRRGGRIRTDDPLTPSQVRYQSALRPGPHSKVSLQVVGGNYLFRLGLQA